jgi:signal transduction histidine kinase
MRPLSLWRSAAFRISLLNALVSASLMTLTALVLFHTFQSIARNRLEHLLADEFVILEQAYSEEGLPGTIDALRQSVRAYSDENRIYAVADPFGRIVAGNAPRAPNFFGYAEFLPSAFGRDSGHRYLVLAREFGGFRFIVGVETLAFDETIYTLFQALLFAAFASAALSILFGAVIGARAAGRLENIRTTIDRFSNGDLNARIQTTGETDDIDLISAQINTKLGRIQEMMAAIKETGADIAHDLRSPLSRLYLDLQDIAPFVAERPEAHAKLEDATAHAEDLIAMFDAILTLTQVEAAKGASRFQPLDLGRLCGELAETYAPVAAEHGQTLTCDVRDDLTYPIEGDRPLIARMIVNLVENAIRHTPEGSRIHVSLERSDGNVVLTVTDNGPGIPPDEREKVFERFYRAERSRTTPGSGLGMPLIRAITEHHSGTIALDDAAPGLITRITFPAATTASPG